MKNILHSITYLLIIILITSSCGDDIIPNESELITSAYISLIDTSQLDTLQLKFIDLDGDGGLQPVIMAPRLKSGTYYKGNTLLLNESQVPAVNISEEIASEKETHQFFYVISDPNLIDIQYKDSDANGRPLGADFSLITHQAGQITMKVVLRHEPDKNATGVAQGNIMNAGGETDLEIEFNIEIQ